MASTLKHLRSSSADKRPTASGLADGQLAINTASGTPGLFFKDSNNTIVKVGPAHVDATAPNATPAGSAGNSKGEFWVDINLVPSGLKVWNGSAFSNLTPSGSETVPGLLEVATPGEVQTGTDHQRAVTPSGLQSKISDSTSTVSSATIASSTAVKSAYDLANAALPKAGGTLTGELLISPSGSLVFEGSTDDGFETTLAVTNPTADRTITFPNVTGTVVTTGDSGTVTSTMIADGTIVNADINASAAIAYGKLALASGIVDSDISGSAEIAVSKLADGAARQLLQTDAAGTGVEWASNIDIPGTLDVTSAATFDSSATIAGDLTVDTSTLKVDSTNNRVGIGTASPEQLLDVRGVVQIKNAGTCTLRFNDSTTNYWDIQNDSNLRFSRGGSEYARIDSSGNMAVGTSSPLTNGYPAFTVSNSTQANLYFEDTGYEATGDGVGYFSWDNGALSFTTASRSGTGTTGSSERLRIDSSGRLLVGTSSASGLDRFIVEGGTGYSAAIASLRRSQAGSAIGSGAEIGYLFFGGNDNTSFASIAAWSDGTTGVNDYPGRLVFSTTADGSATPSARMTIDSLGRLLVGTSSARAIEPFANTTGGTANQSFLGEQTHADGKVGIACVSNSDTTADYGSYIYLARTRGSSVGANTIVQSGDNLGTIGFAGADGTDIRTKAAAIYAAVDGTPGANDMPGRLVFATTADGAASPTERMRIDSSGRVGIGTTSPATTLAVNGNITLADTGTGASYITGVKAGNSFYIGVDNSTGSTFGSGTAYSPIIYTGANAPITFSNNSTERARIDSSGKLLVGTSSYTGTATAVLLGNSGSATAQGVLILQRGEATPADGAALGGVFMQDNTINNSAAIIAYRDGGTWSSTSKPTRLTFSTTADGASSLTERMRIDSSGRLLVGTSTSRASYAANLEIEATTSAASIAVTRNSNDANPAYLYLSKSRSTSVGGNTIVLDGDTLGDISFLGSDGTAPKIAAHIKAQVDGTPGANDMPGRLVFSTTADGAASPTERIRIDSSGRLLVGTSTAESTTIGGLLQIQATGSSASLLIKRNSANASAPYIYLAKSRGANNATTIVASGDSLGELRFAGADGSTEVGSLAALIKAEVDGTPGANDMPGRLVFSTTADGASSPTERFRISNTGVSTFTAGGATVAGNLIATFVGGGIGLGVQFYEGANTGASNAANSTVKIGQTNLTGRSINAAGSLNANGADYAEYMFKAGDFTITKGDVCGIDANGKLTTTFADAISFVVKSTDPSYVGNDSWGIGFEDDEEALEAERQKVDRVAFAGQVPVNVLGATPGQYIVPVEDAGGGIEGIAKNETDLTLAEYMRAVGKVIAIEDDGRARIIVKVA